MNDNEKKEVRPIPVDGQPGLSSAAKINMSLRMAPSLEAIQLIPETVARNYRMIPIKVTEDTLTVVMANPDDIRAIEALSALTKKRIDIMPLPATATEIQEAIDFNYKAFGDISARFSSVDLSSEITSPENISKVIADDSPIAQALLLIIEEAVKSRASDIHIEPETDHLRIRFRIDGVLHEIISLPSGVQPPLISRIKILSNMNIADRLRPQDGQMSIHIRDRHIDIRVAIINGVYGEMAVMRLLDKSVGALPLSSIGFLPESREKFEKMLVAPFGMILISGPTGSGKTTTLYAATNSLDREKNNIITIEDPVEYRFPGINQIQVNPKSGVTFASGLRSIVRLDPDVILVGEIRDGETAQIAVQSALTGHLVLTSVHANTTTSALYRLIDLGVEPFLISASIIGIIAQRMVRRVCPYCAHVITAPLVERLAFKRVTGEERTEFVYGAGCKACVFTGYLGRTGIFEIMTISDEIRHMLISGAQSSEITQQALREGMVNISMDGMLKVRAGITTPYEVLRNIELVS